MRILVCGGREFSNESIMHVVFSDYHEHEVQLIHGDCRGADRLAERVGESLGWVVTPYPPDWVRDGRAAGPMRNQRMLDEGKPDLVIAFPGGKGTGDMVTRARKAGVPVRIVR